MYVRNGYNGDSETVDVLARHTALKRWIIIIIIINYCYAQIWLKYHRILGLQEHFTIRRMHLESSVIQRMSKAEKNCQSQSGPKHREKSSDLRRCLETSQWRRWGDARWQTVPYMWSRDQKWVITNGGVALWRYSECRCRRQPKTPSQVYVCHYVEFISKIWWSRRMQAMVREHCKLELDPLRHSHAALSSQTMKTWQLLIYITNSERKWSRQTCSFSTSTATSMSWTSCVRARCDSSSLERNSRSCERLVRRSTISFSCFSCLLASEAFFCWRIV